MHVASIALALIVAAPQSRSRPEPPPQSVEWPDDAPRQAPTADETPAVRDTRSVEPIRPAGTVTLTPALELETWQREATRLKRIQWGFAFVLIGGVTLVGLPLLLTGADCHSSGSGSDAESCGGITIPIATIVGVPITIAGISGVSGLAARRKRHARRRPQVALDLHRLRLRFWAETIFRTIGFADASSGRWTSHSRRATRRMPALAGRGLPQACVKQMLLSWVRMACGCAGWMGR